MIQSIILIAVAGAAGAVSRYLVGLGATRLWGPQFPYSTLFVNVLGCFLLGMLLEVEHNTTLVSQPARLFLAVGFLGAFTTFSTFGYETFSYLNSGTIKLALVNVSANVLLGLGAVWLGWFLGRTFFQTNI